MHFEERRHALIAWLASQPPTLERKLKTKKLQASFGKVFADRGYVSRALAQKLFEDYGIEFVA